MPFRGWLSCQRHKTLSVAMLLLLGATVSCPSILADTITFVDNDIVAVQIQASNPSRVDVVFNDLNFADVDLLSPSPGAVAIGETLGTPHLSIGEFTTTCGPTGLTSGCESDTISFPLGLFSPPLRVVFFSDPADSFPCAAEVCQIFEDGTVQTAGTILWSDGTVDTIKFQSVEAVPEPSTLILFLTAALGGAIYGRTQKQVRH